MIPGRKASGGRYKRKKKIKLRDRKQAARLPTLGEKEKKKKLRTLGGNLKVALLRTNTVNVIDKEKKARKVKIKNVLEVPSNRFYARKNILTKGTIIETELGKARITNRPGQEGSVQAVLI